MKIKTLLVALLGSLFLASCFEDDSSLNYKLMNPIVIDLGDEPSIRTGRVIFSVTLSTGIRL